MTWYAACPRYAAALSARLTQWYSVGLTHTYSTKQHVERHTFFKIRRRVKNQKQFKIKRTVENQKDRMKIRKSENRKTSRKWKMKNGKMENGRAAENATTTTFI